MKTFRLLGMAIGMAVVCALFGACTDGESEGITDYSKDIIGIWYGTPFENEKSIFYRNRLTFMENGSFKLETGDYNEKNDSRWVWKGDSVLIHRSFREQVNGVDTEGVGSYTVVSNRLMIDNNQYADIVTLKESKLVIQTTKGTIYFTRK